MVEVPFSILGPPHAGLHVSKLCLGTMTYGEQNSYEDAHKQLNMARDIGINFIDTAEMYPVPQRGESQGKSEEYVGRWIKERRISREKIVIATKVAGPSGQMAWIRGGPLCLDRKNITKAIDGSLKRLQTDYIDLYQLHWPDRYVPMFGEMEYDPTRRYSSVPIDEQLDALSTAIAAGKIRHVGVSNETPYGLMEFCYAANNQPHFPYIITIQNAYNLLCRTFDAGLAECCHQQRVSLLAYSPLAMGLLSGKYLAADGGPIDARLNLYKGRYAEAECRYSFMKPNLIPAVKAYVEIARRHNISPVELAIGFVLGHPLVGSVIIGATKVSQLREIFNNCEAKLSPEILTEVEEVHRRFPSPCP